MKAILAAILFAVFGLSTSAMAWDGGHRKGHYKQERHYYKKCKKCNKDRRDYRDSRHSYEHKRHHDRRYSYHR